MADLDTGAHHGFAAGLGHKLDAGVSSGLLRDLHAVVVRRAGHTVLERYYAGPDEAWDEQLGVTAFGPDVLHDVRSISKTVVGLLYGIALQRGLVPPPAAGLLAQFPEYADLAADPARRGICVRHALNMTMGLAWNEWLPYTDPANSERAMGRAADVNRYVLEQPVVAAPGVKWTYSGGAVALLGSLIERGTGMPLARFAGQALFQPLGIERFEWTARADGTALAAAGLRLSAPSLARLGQLVLAGGVWDGAQLVGADWLRASLTPSANAMDELRYGQLWFVGEARTPALDGPQAWYGAFGNGGQRLWVMPSAGLAVAVLSGAYDRDDAWITPVRLWREIVLANLLRV